MESVLTAVIVLFIIVFAALTLAYAFFDGQQTLQAEWRAMEARAGEQAQTALAAVEARIIQSGTIIEFTARNSGSTRLADFEQWDAVLHYYDTATPPGYHIDWLPYTRLALVDNRWTVGGIYLDDAAEVYEPDILNPGEAMTLRIQVKPAVGIGQTIYAVFASPNGTTVSGFARRNYPPVLATNQSVKIASGATATINTALLETTDVDNEPDELVYTIDTLPAQGMLTPAEFTQADINDGAVSYQHTGTGGDSFEFTVFDGIDTIGTYTFTVTVNTPPVVSENAGLTLPAGGTGAIGDLLLKAEDADDPAADLAFTVTTPPAQGTLSMATTFTQADIEAGNVSYQHTGTGADSFSFTVTDGYDVIGEFTFTITVI